MPRLSRHIKSPKAAREIVDCCEKGADLSDLEEMMGYTDCPEGCFVEPDGTCTHGYVSAMLTLMRST
jgi:hypothetical protein